LQLDYFKINKEPLFLRHPRSYQGFMVVVVQMWVKVVKYGRGFEQACTGRSQVCYEAKLVQTISIYLMSLVLAESFGCNKMVITYCILLSITNFPFRT